MKIGQIIRSLSKFNFTWKVTIKVFVSNTEDLKSPVPTVFDFKIDSIICDAKSKTVFIYCKK